MNATMTENGTKAARKVNAFKVLCPECLNPDATVRLDLNDLKAATCSECDASFSPAQAVASLAKQVERWKAVERWVGMAGAALAGLSDDDEPFA